MTPEIIAVGFGGLGLFLLGMWLITEGLRVAAAGSLARLLAHWTSNRARGLLAGTLLTAALQSSSAVTVATLGFVNTGLLRFERAVWVIFGSNLGTTLTAWLVALIGFKFKVDVLALPLIGVGAMLRVFAPTDRYRSLGMALAGFGILFLGIETLAAAFTGVAPSLPLQVGAYRWVVMVGSGIILTTLMQSSSAAIAVVLTALAGGLLGLTDAAAVVIGANVGTTSTALIATLGATANARRLAFAHVLFNVFTAIVALLMLYPLLGAVQILVKGLALGNDPTTALAMFHTLFNLLGVLLMWPVEPRMSRFLQTCFQRRQMTSGALQYLDGNVAGFPDAARVALGKELSRLLAQYPTSVGALARERGGDSLPADRRQVLDGIGEFLIDVSRRELTSTQAEIFIQGWHIQHNLVNIEEALAVLRENNNKLRSHADASRATALLEEWFTQLQDILAKDWIALSGDEQPGSFAAIESAYESVKATLLQSAIAGELDRQVLDQSLQMISISRRVIEQWYRALGHYQLLRRSTSPDLRGAADCDVGGPETAGATTLPRGD